MDNIPDVVSNKPLAGYIYLERLVDVFSDSRHRVTNAAVTTRGINSNVIFLILRFEFDFVKFKIKYTDVALDSVAERTSTALLFTAIATDRKWIA
ncbi:hypothetical protein OUZ56_028827 [Daphnia magna]|uniref:Uncharacterized protein n=1 Tax=Daphnia magna TaxID=35525 RepID=A0ABR0B521_9CRUS|nr:hypothetical protein OUZ56_028827 [Daphnia magna]